MIMMTLDQYAEFESKLEGMKKGIFVYPRYTATRKDNAFSWLKEEAALCGLSLEICFEEDCRIEYGPQGSSISFAGVPMDDVSFVVMRTYNDRISMYYEQKPGVFVINESHAMRVCRDKLLTHQVLTAAGLPTPYTMYAPFAGYDEVCEAMGEGRFLVKQINGSKGENIFLVSGREEFDAAVDGLRPDCIFQKFIGESSGRDIRVWVLGDKCIGSVLRYSETSFLSNFSQGGSFKAVDIDEVAYRLAVDAVKAVGLGFAGVDLLFCGDSYSVCEVNGNAGFRTISKASEISIPSALFQFISEKVN
jgi:RimK family alpha-L-glutamate ligase